MRKKVIASLAGSYRGQSLAGKDSHSSGTEQHLLLFPVHPVAAQVHGLGVPVYPLGVDDPTTQSARRGTDVAEEMGLCLGMACSNMSTQLPSELG